MTLPEGDAVRADDPPGMPMASGPEATPGPFGTSPSATRDEAADHIEEERRKAIEARAPERSRLKAVTDRLPSGDPWLDDEYDWEL